jgi:hypothetical protein
LATVWSREASGILQAKEPSLAGRDLAHEIGMGAVMQARSTLTEKAAAIQAMIPSTRLTSAFSTRFSVPLALYDRARAFPGPWH